MSITNIQISELFQSLEIMGSIHSVQWKKLPTEKKKLHFKFVVCYLWTHGKKERNVFVFGFAIISYAFS